MNESKIRSGTATLWSELNGAARHLDCVRLTRIENHLPSVYDVSGLAASVVAAANLAVAEVLAFRSRMAELPPVELSGLESSAAFRSEALLKPLGWNLSPAWDPIAGDYLAGDGWIRIHTNYENHRTAALAALNLSAAERSSVAEAVSKCSARELESQIVEQGGCAAAMLSEEDWAADSMGAKTLTEPVVALARKHSAHCEAHEFKPGDAALSGIRVLDLTRVLAGPECTRFLAAWGADVLRIDPPGFQEVPAVVPDMTVGKRCGTLSLRESGDRERFFALVRQAQVVVLGYRADALEKFGVTVEEIYSFNPRIIIARLNAYGWTGPLQDRRGFDSLIQMHTGIAARGMSEKRAQKPIPLPAQALDHGAGFVLAAGICRALHSLWVDGTNSLVTTSLVGVANFLKSHFREGDADGPPADFSRVLEEAASEWGPVCRVTNPGLIGGRRGAWRIPAGSLGRHACTFDEEKR
jgi:hypothetical protein